MNKPTDFGGETRYAVSPLLEWINSETDFIHANRDWIRDRDLDDFQDPPSPGCAEKSHDRSIAKQSRAQAHAVPASPAQMRKAKGQAQVEQGRSNGSRCQKAACATDQTSATSKEKGNPGETDDGDRPAILDLLDAEERYTHRSDHELMGRSLDDERKATDTTPLDQVDRTRTRRLLNNKNLDVDDRTAIQWFLGEFKRSKWMHWQGFYPERIAMTVLSSWERGRDVAYCGYAGRDCNEPDFCPKCALTQRADPAVTEYEGLYDRLLPGGQRRYFYAVTLSYDWNPDRAGLHFVIEKRNREKGTPDKLLHDYPFKERPPVKPLTLDHDIGDENKVTACFRAIFALAKFLSKLGKEWGVLAHRHIAWHFFEYPGLPHHIRPNGHLLLVTDEPITFEVGKLLLGQFQRLYRKQNYGDVLYCDAHISPLVSQADIERWIYYIFKPMDFVKPYRDAVQRGVSIEALNHEVDNCVFQGGNSVLSVPSPMRYGALHVNVGPDRYLGTKNVTLQRKEAKAAKEANRQKNPAKSQPYQEPPRYLERLARHEQFLRDEGSF